MTVLIIEDEPRTAGLLKEFIRGHSTSVEILPVIDSVEGSVGYLSDCKRQPDLIFMDIQLSDGISFDILSQVKVTSPVIFCTAFEEFTLQAFKSNGIAYILKPFAEADIASALAKIEQLKKALSPETKEILIPVPYGTAPKKMHSHFLVNYREKMYPVSVDNIAAFYVDEDQVYLVTFNDFQYPLSRKMEEVENLIDTATFFRISRQMIINRHAIENIEQYFNRKLFVKLKIVLPVKPVVSRLKVGPFMQWIETI